MLFVIPLTILKLGGKSLVEKHDINYVQLQGFIEQPFKFSHTEGGIRIFSSTFIAIRLSGTPDRIPISIEENLLRNVDDNVFSETIKVEGYIISNTRYSKLNICVRIKKIMFAKELDNVRNKVKLSGKIASDVKMRERQNGVFVSEFMLASVLDEYRKIYVPVIAWNNLAKLIVNFKPGNELVFDARFQSREFEKRNLDGTSQKKEVYEVSMMKLKHAKKATVY